MSNNRQIKLTIEPTSGFTVVSGCPVRLWKGVTEQGAPCTVFVARVAVPEGTNQNEFQNALLTTPPGHVMGPDSEAVLKALNRPQLVCPICEGTGEQKEDDSRE